MDVIEHFNRSAHACQAESGFEYTHCFWGELIRGSREQIQALGIAVGLAFPGEVGGPKRKLNVIDPRGFKTSVGRYDDGRFCARVEYPDRGYPPAQWRVFAEGVQIAVGNSPRDEYVGTATALAAAGLVRLDQLPGQPGARKVTVTIFADGSLPTGGVTANHGRGFEPGAKMITRASKTTFRVQVAASEHEARRRSAAARSADDEHRARMWALPRPAPLNAGIKVVQASTKNHLHLAWSAKPNASARERYPLNVRRWTLTQEELRWIDAYPGLDEDTARLAVRAAALSKSPRRAPVLRLVKSQPSGSESANE